MVNTNGYHYNVGAYSHNFDIFVAINRCIINVNKHSAICLFVVTHLQATRVDIFIGHDMLIFCCNKKGVTLNWRYGISSHIEQLFLVVSNPHKIFELSYGSIVLYRYSDTFSSASSCYTLHSDVAIHIKHVKRAPMYKIYSALFLVHNILQNS